MSSRVLRHAHPLKERGHENMADDCELVRYFFCVRIRLRGANLTTQFMAKLAADLKAKLAAEKKS